MSNFWLDQRKLDRNFEILNFGDIIHNQKVNELSDFRFTVDENLVLWILREMGSSKPCYAHFSFSLGLVPLQNQEKEKVVTSKCTLSNTDMYALFSIKA